MYVRDCSVWKVSGPKSREIFAVATAELMEKGRLSPLVISGIKVKKIGDEIEVNSSYRCIRESVSKELGIKHVQ